MVTAERAHDSPEPDVSQRLTIGTPASAELWALLEEVTDPEIPVLTIRDLGILRGVHLEGERVVVTITPTYSGCPAMATIEEDVRAALNGAGYHDVEIKLILSPAWTTDWMSTEGREKLRDYGIAPPAGSCGKDGESVSADSINCPQCGSDQSRLISEFGSTACKALYQCQDCREPFDYFKCI
jgi:ring-1,2-phenylacetyl-CoA epoxidase subunit PaaD